MCKQVISGSPYVTDMLVHFMFNRYPIGHYVRSCDETIPEALQKI